MKLLYKTCNECIICNEVNIFSNLSESEMNEILKREGINFTNKVYEQESLEFMLKLADAIGLPNLGSWGKYVELLSNGEMVGYKIEDQKFPFEQLKDLVKDEKEWKREFAKEINFFWMSYHTGF